MSPEKFVPLILILSLGCLNYDPSGPGDEPGHTSAANVVWEVTLDEYSGGHLRVLPTADGGCALLYTSDLMRLARVGPDGTLYWKHGYADTSFVSTGGMDCRQVTDGGFVLAGYGSTFDWRTGSTLIKTNAMGDPSWSTTQIRGQDRWVTSVAVGQDGAYYCAASVLEQLSSGRFAVCEKYSEAGELEWQKRCSMVEWDYPLGLWNIPQVGLLVCVERDAVEKVLILIDETGDVIWERSLKSDPSMYETLLDVGRDGRYGVAYTSLDGLESIIREYDLDGTLRWEYRNPTPQPSLTGCYLEDGSLVALVDDSESGARAAVCVNDQGEFRWQRDLPGLHGTPSIAGSADGDVLVASAVGYGVPGIIVRKLPGRL